MCAILAAGASSRMGRPKAQLVYDGRSFLERALDAAAGYPTVVVVSDAATRDAARALAATASDIRVVVNAQPERGMSRSLALADAALADPGAACAVLLVDTPLVDAALVARVFCGRGDCDVAYPMRDGAPGHPVVFGPRARERIRALADGDTLRRLRDDPELTRAIVSIEQRGPFTDVDTPEALAALDPRYGR